jgi:hypothetical protein
MSKGTIGFYHRPGWQEEKSLLELGSAGDDLLPFGADSLIARDFAWAAQGEPFLTTLWSTKLVRLPS